MSQDSSETLTARLESVGRALQRLFYLNVAVSLVVGYLIAEALSFPLFVPSRREGLTLSIQESLDLLDPLLRLGDILQVSPEAVHAYRTFLRPLAAIEDTASQLVVAVDVQDPLWLNLDAHDRLLSRDQALSLANIQVSLDAFSTDDLRTSHVEYLDTIVRMFVFPEKLLDGPRVLEHVQASARVARALGGQVSEPSPWPQSIYFLDFLKTEGSHKDLVGILEECRNVEQLPAAVQRLSRFCEANEVPYCSVNSIEALLRRPELTLEGDVLEDKIEVTFLPTGVQRRFLIAGSPLALLAGSHLFLAHYRRRRLLRAQLAEGLSAMNLDLLESSWLIPNIGLARRDNSLRFGAAHRLFLYVFLTLGQLVTITAQVLVAVFLWATQTDLANRFFWFSLTGACIAGTVLSVGACLSAQWEDCGLGSRKKRSA